jgi:pimeloyl-ACP methyl ester carboxylesterase
VNTVQSKDGTRIAYNKAGDGPPLILVDGAACYRKFGPSTRLAKPLSGHFTVVTYDRRGRGDSGDNQPYAAEREIEDLQALIDHAGGSTHLFGVSSGAALALETAARGTGVSKLGLYEAPFTDDASRAAAASEYSALLTRQLATGRRGNAVQLFLRRAGVPGALITLMRILPVWSKLTAIPPRSPTTTRSSSTSLTPASPPNATAGSPVSWPDSSLSPGLARPTFILSGWIRPSGATGSAACCIRRSSRLPGLAAPSWCARSPPGEPRLDRVSPADGFPAGARRRRGRRHPGFLRL